MEWAATELKRSCSVCTLSLAFAVILSNLGITTYTSCMDVCGVVCNLLCHECMLHILLTDVAFERQVPEEKKLRHLQCR